MIHLKRNLVNASIETLIEPPICNEKYLERSILGNSISDAMVTAITPAINEHSNNYRAVVQGLFESGYLSVSDRDFSFDQLLKYSLGVKMHHALDAFNELFDMLVGGGYTDPRSRDTEYNSSGDNYYSAMTFGGQRKVIFVENQSPSWVYVLEHEIHTGKPKDLYMIRLKSEYDDPDKIQAVIDMEADFTDRSDHQFSAYDRKQVHRIIARLDIMHMSCEEGWWEPSEILFCLFNIYSGRDSIH